MTEKNFTGIELIPETVPATTLYILLHGVGANPSNLLPLANILKLAFPNAAFLLPQGTFPFDGGGSGRQWFSIKEVSEENRITRVAEAMPTLHALVKHAQERFHVSHADTTLIGFSQGAIMALEFSIAHDGCAGRVLAFSGRFSTLPEKAPEHTKLHILHGENDPVISVGYAQAAFKRITELNGDITIDTASAGHEINAELADHAVHRLRTG